jgi:hypothetical protein
MHRAHKRLIQSANRSAARVGRAGDLEKLILKQSTHPQSARTPGIGETGVSAADGPIGAETTAAGKGEVRMAATSALTFTTFS